MLITTRKKIIAFMMFYLFMTQAEANLINFSSVLLTLTSQEPMAVLEVRNLSDDKVVMQADTVAWSQEANEMVTSPTEDVLVSPPIFELEGKHTQLLRIAWLKDQPLASQLTYRILLREISDAAPMLSQQKGLKINLLVSIPIFIQPMEQKPAFRWRVESVDKNNIKINFDNLGNMVFHVAQIDLLSNHHKVISHKTFAYILPKHTYTWTFKVNKNDFNHLEAIVNGERKMQHIQDFN
ncbi:MAG: molecular chaperone [Gammaproteobacteria bacterium]|nr:molecular chaperone [Gammaproteobacteria bacterium]